jgi:hypothetical protein
MKKRITALLAGLVLASGMSAVSAAGVSEVLGNSDYQAMSNQEMGAVQGEIAFARSRSNADALGLFFAYTGTINETVTLSTPFLSQARSRGRSTSFAF